MAIDKEKLEAAQAIMDGRINEIADAMITADGVGVVVSDYWLRLLADLLVARQQSQAIIDIDIEIDIESNPLI